MSTTLVCKLICRNGPGEELRTPKSTVQKVLKKVLKVKPYRIQMLQALPESDKQQR
jgi:hypothetical protein